MNLRKAAKAILLFVLLPIFVAVVGGYIVERIKGTPPGEIAAALWHPFGASIGGTSAWLRGPVQLTHFSVLVFLAMLAWLAFSLFQLRRRLNHVAGRVFYTSLGDLTDQITKLQELNRQVAEGEPKEASANAKVAEGFEPNRVQLIAAKVLIDRYPKRLQLPDLAAALQQVAGGVVPMPAAPQGEIARQMEAMEQKGVATIDDPNSVMAYYGLTRHGRDFMLEKLHAPSSRAGPQPAVDPRRLALRGLEDGAKS